MAVLKLPVVLVESALAPAAVLKKPSVLLEKCQRSVGRILEAGSVQQQRCNASGRILLSAC